MRGRRTRRLHACILGAAAALTCGAWAARASADGLPSDPGASSHVLIGMLPGTGFEITCDDSLLSDEPVSSDDLGIVWFTIDQRVHGTPSTVRIKVPAPPVITGQHVADLGDTFAVVQWQTDRLAVSQVEYGPTTAYGQVTPLSQRYTRNHSITVGDLVPQAGYHYRAVSLDAFGHRTVTADGTLTTLPARPRMSDAAGQALSSSSILVSWRTTVPCDTRAEYGLDGTYGSWSADDAALTLEHSVVIEGLSPYTEYHFRAWSTDEYGQPVNSGDRVVMTLPPELQFLQVAVADTNSVTATIAWTTSNPATSLVEYGVTDAYGLATTQGTDLLTEHLVVLEGLTPDTLYHFRVVSTDEYAQEIASPDAVFTTHPLGMPEVLVIYIPGVSALGWNSATVGWLTNLPANSAVEYGPTAAYGDVITNGSYGVRHEIVIPGLAEGSLYHFRVVSTTAAGTTTVTEDASFRTLLRPLEVGGLSVTGITETAFTVEWTTTRPASAQVEYGVSDLYGSSTPLVPELSTEHSATVSGLSPGTTYHFRAKGTDADGYPALSADQTVATAAPALALFDVSVPDTTDVSATIVWRTTNPATSRVEYGTSDAYGQVSAETSALTTDHAITLEGLSPGTEYHFRTLSVDGYMQEGISPDFTFLTWPEGTASLLIDDVAATDLGPSYATISWHTNRSASSVVEYGATASYGLVESLSGLVTRHSVILSGLAENTLYHYRVRSETYGGAGATSADGTFSTPGIADLMPPETPHGLAALSRPGGVTLTWEANSEQDLAEYAVTRRAESDDGFSEIARIPAHETSYADDDAVPGLVYEYAVAAIDGSGNESSACAAVRAVAAADAAGGLWAFPNPARDAVSIRFAIAGGQSRAGVAFTVAIHDAGGRLVKAVAQGETTSGYGTVSWDVTDSAGRRVPSGVYFCTASFPLGEVRTKVMIVR
jgi:hypothetical protein